MEPFVQRMEEEVNKFIVACDIDGSREFFVTIEAQEQCRSVMASALPLCICEIVGYASLVCVLVEG